MIAWPENTNKIAPLAISISVINYLSCQNITEHVTMVTTFIKKQTIYVFVMAVKLSIDFRTMYNAKVKLSLKRKYIYHHLRWQQRGTEALISPLEPSSLFSEQTIHQIGMTNLNINKMCMKKESANNSCDSKK